MSLRKCLLAICVLLAVAPVMAQERPHVKVETAAARAADVSTIDGVIKAFYEVISGPAGQPRQWSRDRTLYIPDVRFVPVERGRDGKVHAQPITHQQFVDSADAGLVKRGFWETEIHRETLRYGNIVHVFSTYETRAKTDGPATGRGINSLQLFHDGERWWILAAQWEDERPENPIPARFLPPAPK